MTDPPIQISAEAWQGKPGYVRFGFLDRVQYFIQGFPRESFVGIKAQNPFTARHLESDLLLRHVPGPFVKHHAGPGSEANLLCAVGASRIHHEHLVETSRGLEKRGNTVCLVLGNNHEAEQERVTLTEGIGHDKIMEERAAVPIFVKERWRT